MNYTTLSVVKRREKQGIFKIDCCKKLNESFIENTNAIRGLLQTTENVVTLKLITDGQDFSI